jgi:hypothetical protein
MRRSFFVPYNGDTMQRVTFGAMTASMQTGVPKGTIQAVELERENKRLIYSHGTRTRAKTPVKNP